MAVSRGGENGKNFGVKIISMNYITDNNHFSALQWLPTLSEWPPKNATFAAEQVVRSPP